VATQDGRFATTLQNSWPDTQTWQAYHYLTPIRGIAGEAIVSAGEDVVAFRRRDDKGTLIYFGTSLGEPLRPARIVRSPFYKLCFSVCVNPRSEDSV